MLINWQLVNPKRFVNIKTRKGNRLIFLYHEDIRRRKLETRHFWIGERKLTVEAWGDL